MHSSRTAFSLIELLVALSILGIVAAIVVPNLLNIRSSSHAAVAQQLASQLNSTFQNWIAQGGVCGSAAETSDILYVITGASTTLNANRTASQNVTDSGSSANTRTTLPGALPAQYPSLDPSQSYNPMAIVHAGDYFITFSNGTFNAMAFDNLTFSQTSDVQNSSNNVNSQGHGNIILNVGSGQEYPVGNFIWGLQSPLPVMYNNGSGNFVSAGITVPNDGSSGTVYGVSSSGIPLKIQYSPHSGGGGGEQYQVFELQ